MIDPQKLKLTNDFLGKLGFDSEEIKLYIALVENGPMTLLEASRKSSIERTRLYRMIDKLAEKGLIAEVPEYKRTTIKAADLNTIELLIKQKELENKFLADSLPTFSEALRSFANPFPGSNVVYYRGIEGIKQQTWHMLDCKKFPFQTYSYCFWNDIFGESFTLKLNRELLYRKFIVHDIYSDQYIKYKDQWYAKFGKPAGDWNFWESRYIPEKIATISMNMDVYNNVVSYYYWQENEVFGVEIYNDRVAEFHKQIHKLLWSMAKPLGSFDWRKPANTWKKLGK